LSSGRIQYKALDGAWRLGAASNCIHAVSDIDADDGYLTVDGAYGVPASARVVEHLSGWLIQPDREHPSIDEKLGLSGQSITRVAWSFRAFGSAVHGTVGAARQDWGKDAEMNFSKEEDHEVKASN
jgi:hypothetical protein